MSQNNKMPFLSIKLSGDFHKPPVIRENKNFDWIWAGKDNSYFEYLIACYQYSPTHSAIINGKAKYLYGKGPEWNGAGKAKFDELCKKFKLKKQLLKLFKDFEMFNGYHFKAAVNTVIENDKILTQFEHLPFRAMRANKDVNQFYHSNNWTKEQTLEPYFKKTVRPADLIVYDKYIRPNVYSQVWNNYYLDPGSKVYPLAPYTGGLAVVQTEIEINNFNLVSAKTMFSSDLIVSIPKPRPETNREKAEYENMFKDKFSGSDNAGEIVMFFSDDGEPLKIDRIAPSNLPDLYKDLLPNVEAGIFTAHEVTSPMLFGKKTEGQLGGRNELLDAYELFEHNYLSPRRYEVESDLTDFFNSLGIEGELTFPPQPPLSLVFSEPTIVEVLRSTGRLNKAVGEYINDPELEDMPDVIPTISPSIAEQSPLQAALAKFDSIGKPCEHYTILAALNCPRYKTVDEYTAFEAKVKKLNFSKFSFAELSDLESELLGLLVADDEYTLDDLAEKTGANKKAVIGALNRIQELNMIQYTTNEAAGKVTVTRDAVSVEPKKYTTNILYRYWGPRDSKNREFCSELLKKNKLYTYAELLNMKNPDGDSFLLHRGGWYHDPNTGVNRDNCRHILQAVIVAAN